MAKLIFDIETAGESWDSLDEISKKSLMRRFDQKYAKDSDEYNIAFENLKTELVFSPLTSEIVAIGVLDHGSDKGVVCFQSPGNKQDNFEEDGFIFKAMSEKQMLENFWQGAEKYDEFISFNGRGFDVPFMMIRSAINDVRPTKNLMANRYLNSQPFGAIHVDVYDQFTFYGASRKTGSLHLFTRAFGIKSPKDEGVSGDDVTSLFREKKFLDIARYNTRDLVATKQLYDYWQAYLRF